MLKKLRVVLIVFVLVAGGMIACSCEHEGPEESPRISEPGVDGVAVRELPEMDAELAERVLRDGPVGATADITHDESAGSLATEAGAAPAGAVGGTPTEAAPSAPSERFDPNL
jgi:hypothetical protein